MAGVPWIYNNKGLPGSAAPEVHEDSTYNRKPKGSKHTLGYEAKLAMIRKNLSTQPERQLRLRQDYQAQKPPAENEKVWIGVWKSLQGEVSAAKYGKAEGRAQRANKAAEDKELGIESRKKSPVKTQRGSSRGGKLSKKEREHMALSRGTVGVQDGNTEVEEEK
jgi:hypothetical protein